MRQQVNKRKNKAKIIKMDDPRNVGASNMKINSACQPNATESFDLNLGQLGLGCYISMPSIVQNYYLTADP